MSDQPESFSPPTIPTLSEVPTEPLTDGQVRLRIDPFALTSNNVTYAAFGDLMNYWHFYPTGDATTGCIPVWGFGTVTESRTADIAEGDRFYGYYPIADDVVLPPHNPPPPEPKPPFAKNCAPFGTSDIPNFEAVAARISVARARLSNPCGM